MNKKLHIICFDVPFPATYGGVIDVFFKIQSLYKSGAKIYLHAFEYGRKEQAILKEYCAEVHYYQRKTSLVKALGPLPYIVCSRSDEQLIKNLRRIDAPILFEGLHSTLVLHKKKFTDRKLLVRTHNIEHQYYKQLAVSETNLFKKFYYSIASIKLKKYENVLKHSDQILSISKEDAKHFRTKYGEKITFLPAFQPYQKLHQLSKKGYFAMYHGNLNITDNIKVALFLIDVFKIINYPLVIAGQTKDKKLLSKIDQAKNISFISITDEDQLLELFHRAHINVLYSFNNSGVKLKLINSLFQSRFVIANSKITAGSGLESLCVIAENKTEIIQQVLKLIDTDFSKEDIEHRKELLDLYNNSKNSQILLDLL